MPPSTLFAPSQAEEILVNADPLARAATRLGRISTRHLQAIAATLWITLVVVVTMLVLVQRPGRGSVVPVYLEAARHWLAGEAIYDNGGLVYRYSPFAAVAFTPFTMVPGRLAELSWRYLNLAILAIGLIAWSKGLLRTSDPKRSFAIVGLAVALLAINSFRNGQTNLLVLGAMMGMTAACQQKRWNLVAAGAAAIFLFKVYPLAFALLLVALYPRELGWRVAVALVIGFATPFLFQNAGYVNQQYASWIASISHDTRMEKPLAASNRDAWLLIRLIGLPIRVEVYRMIQLTSGVALAGYVLYQRRLGRPERQVLNATLALAGIWMLLFGPATESCTYVLLAPALLVGLVDPDFKVRKWTEWSFLGLAIALLFSALLVNLFPFAGDFHTRGPQPFAALLTAIALLLAIERTPADPNPAALAKIP